jgi:dTDP-4-dehydrorhamnose reductase
MSKLVGEWFALDIPRGYVLRVESLFGTPPGWHGRRGSMDGIVAGLEQGRLVRHASWRDVAMEAARLLGVPARLEPITLEQVQLRAPRPRFCALSNRKLADAGFPMPNWRDALARWLASRSCPAA